MNGKPTIKPLDWVEEEPNWWVANPPTMGFGYEVRITDSGKVRTRRATEYWLYYHGSADEAKAAAHDDFSWRIIACLL